MVSKLQERIFVENAAKLLDKRWEIVEIQEPPDFEIRINGDKFGLEVRQIFADPEERKGSSAKKNEAAQQRLLSSIADKYYTEGGIPLDVKILGYLKEEDINDFVQSLLQSKPDEKTSESLGNQTEIKFSNIQAFLTFLPDTDEFAKYSQWIVIKNHVGWVKDITVKELQNAVDIKTSKLPSYKKKYERIVLLLVADGRYKSGMLSASEQIRVKNPGFDSIYFMYQVNQIKLIS